MKVRKMALCVTRVAEKLLTVWLSRLGAFGSDRKPSGTFPSCVSFPRYMKIGLSTWATLSIFVSISIMTGRREASDPFSAINAFFAENARQVALERGFTCKNTDWSRHPSDIADYCVLTNTDQRYSTMYLRLWGNIVRLCLPLFAS